MHHRVSQAEYELLAPHGLAHENPHGVDHLNSHGFSHDTVVPIAGYWELLDEMDLNPEFPFEMYIPLYYDSFKDTHGWSYADLLEQTIYEGHTHDRSVEVYWPMHMNAMDENFSFSSLGSMFKGAGQAASKFGKQAASAAGKYGS